MNYFTLTSKVRNVNAFLSKLMTSKNLKPFKIINISINLVRQTYVINYTNDCVSFLRNTGYGLIASTKKETKSTKEAFLLIDQLKQLFLTALNWV